MLKEIEPKLKTIGDYLFLQKNVHFTIPEFQRNYSWGIQQCEKLWQDIESYFENNKEANNYFFGTIILDCSQKESDSQLILIDGQQRTITFYLLLKALLMKFNEKIPNIPENEDLNLKNYKSIMDDYRKKIIKILYKIEDDTEIYKILQKPDEIPTDRKLIINQ